MTAEQIEVAWPGLLAGLAKHPGVSFAVVKSAEHGPIAIGEHGVIQLDSGEVTGINPLAPFGDQARLDMIRVAEFDNAPDIYLNSMYDPQTDEVAAFEELVGCHGGVGGWQTRAVLVHPSDWTVWPELLDPDGRLVSAEVVHRQMVGWLELLGHRTKLDEADESDTVEEPVEESQNTRS
jgi:hypothetical protein